MCIELCTVYCICIKLVYLFSLRTGSVDNVLCPVRNADGSACPHLLGAILSHCHIHHCRLQGRVQNHVVRRIGKSFIYYFYELVRRLYTIFEC